MTSDKVSRLLVFERIKDMKLTEINWQIAELQREEDRLEMEFDELFDALTEDEVDEFLGLSETM